MIRSGTTLILTCQRKGHPKSIEIHAHDPVRYVSDMLAWVHQAVASERDFFQSVVAGRRSGVPFESCHRVEELVFAQNLHPIPTPYLLTLLRGYGSHSYLECKMRCSRCRTPVGFPFASEEHRFSRFLCGSGFLPASQRDWILWQNHW